MMKLSILGYGAWGSALDEYFSSIGHKIIVNKIDDSDAILVCVPSDATISVLSNYKKEIKDQKIIICSKGFASPEKLLSEAIMEEFDNDLYFLYGPTLADEIKKGKYSAIVISGKKEKEYLKKEFESEKLLVELSDDIIGTQVGSALKNVVNIFIGITEGAGCGQNTQALIFTKGVEEIKKIGIALGADPNTFLGLTCIGDLTLHSRNRMLGVELGKGKNLNEAMTEANYVLEGVITLKNIRSLAKKHKIKIPFIDILYAIMFENMDIEEGIRSIR
ncbi:MAG: NAD(P)H-dependent glycerol-3-phosphate dehydrogenase [Patescibacteria group bacterium]|nr:NAD(P)H-dependent glycerol-3-phosphate dehydrogenase [Patescibacteria group bacterium]